MGRGRGHTSGSGVQGGGRGGELVGGGAAGTEIRPPHTPCRPDCHPSPRGLEPSPRSRAHGLSSRASLGKTDAGISQSGRRRRSRGSLPASGRPPPLAVTFLSPSTHPRVQRSLELQERCVPAPPRTGTRAHTGQASPCPRDSPESWAGGPVSQPRLRPAGYAPSTRQPAFPAPGPNGGEARPHGRTQPPGAHLGGAVWALTHHTHAGKGWDFLLAVGN